MHIDCWCNQLESISLHEIPIWRLTLHHAISVNLSTLCIIEQSKFSAQRKRSTMRTFTKCRCCCGGSAAFCSPTKRPTMYWSTLKTCPRQIMPGIVRYLLPTYLMILEIAINFCIEWYPHRTLYFTFELFLLLVIGNNYNISIYFAECNLNNT